MSSKKNILIIGATGFIGRALAHKLSTSNHNIFLTSRNKKFKFPAAKKIYYGDLTNPQFVKKILTNIDLVYYLAGYKKNIAWHIKQPYKFFYDNHQPFLTFLSALKNSRVKQVVYTSTINAHWANFDSGAAIDGYGLGKLANEFALRSFAAEYPKFDIKIARLTMVYGPGDDFNPKTANFIPAIIDRVAKSKDELIVWGKGTRRLQFIYLDDLVANLIKLPETKKKFFTLGNPQAKSVKQIVELIVKLSGKQLKLKHDLSKPDQDTFLFKFDNPVKSKVPFERGLKAAIDYYYHES